MKKQFINKLAGDLRKAKMLLITRQEEDSKHCWVSTSFYALKLDNSAYQQLVLKFNSYNIVHNLPLEVRPNKTYSITKGSETVEVSEGFKLEQLLSFEPVKQEVFLTNFKYYSPELKQELKVLKASNEGLITVNPIFQELCFEDNPFWSTCKQTFTNLLYGFNNEGEVISLVAPVRNAGKEALAELEGLLQAS